MSARGWAGVLTVAADEFERVRCCGGGEEGCHYEGAYQCIAADLRELAALLDRITPEHRKALRTLSDQARSDAAVEGRHSPSWGAIETTEDVIDILAALHRGPAEQQETGR